MAREAPATPAAGAPPSQTHAGWSFKLGGGSLPDDPLGVTVVRPERRTKADLAAVALILVATLVGVFLLWRGSDVRATVSQPAERPAVALPAPAVVPPTLSEAWRAPSPATPKPVVAGPVAVTAQGNEVLGRDPATGAVLWRYARDIPLCTVGAEWDRAIAVYRKSHNCSEVTSVEGGSGKRGPQRDSDAEFGTQLLSDGTHVTTTGSKIIETWRSDLVRTEQYGVPEAVKNAGNNLRRPDCHYSSVAVGDERVGVIEKCPRETSDRITVIKAKPKDDEKPAEIMTTLSGSSHAEVVAVTKSWVAVVLRDTSELVIYQPSGSMDSRFPVRAPLPAPGEFGIERTTTTSQDMTFWHTGVDTVALDGKTLRPLWTIPDTLGSGLQFGGRLLIPVADGLAVHDPKTGARERVIPVDRQGYRGPVDLRSAGGVILEQRGDTVVALH